MKTTTKVKAGLVVLDAIKGEAEDKAHTKWIE